MNASPKPSQFSNRLLNFGYSLGDGFMRLYERLDSWIDARFGDEPNSGDDALTHQFQSDATIIEEAPVPISAHVALYVVLTLIVIAVLWAVFGTLDRIVVAQGKIATRTPMIVMQPYSTSRITQIHVKPGDHVRKGEVLISFDPAFAQADETSLEQKVRGLNSQVDRIQAELGGAKSFIAEANESPERRTQAQIFMQEMAQYSADLAQRESRAGAIQSQLKAGNNSVVGLRSQLEMARKITAVQERLMSEGAGASLDVIKAQSSQVDFETRLANALGDAGKLMQQLAETEAERRSFFDKWRSDHNQQLVQARRDLTEANETLNKAHGMKDLTEMRSPVDAVVLEIADRSVGSVMREAETLVTLVPDVADLYVEANVPSRDVSYVKVGNSARIKLEAYPFQRYGTLDGNLDIISADSVPLKQDDQSQLVYRVQVRLIGGPREFAAHNIRLRPGLVATVEITTGKRTIASYILDPILRMTDESLKEP
jgi:hemolysin D